MTHLYTQKGNNNMIRTLRGAFHPQADGTAVIETVAGIGFLVNLPANSTLYKKYEGEEVTAYTLMIVKEDDMSLYGFENRDELALFKLLISVNGVGPKAGMAIMSILPEQELRRAIGTGDAKTIAQANGVGKKTAERVILELKDKNLLSVDMLTEDSDPVDGDEVVTSYISDKYLPGLLIGYISNVEQDKTDLTYTANVTPAVDFEHLSNVLVIKQLKSDLPDQGASASESESSADGTEQAQTADEE